MIVTRLFEPAIAQASYLIGCAATGDAIVIDPNRDVQRYIDEAAREGLRISHVSETHIHADFASGARELAQRTGASLYLSDEGDADWKYAFIAEGRPLRHGDRITVGNIRLDVWHTPGHTPEHLTFLVTDGAAADRPIAAVTGDFLFVGDVGRPDLLERAAHVHGTMEAGARSLWRSLQTFNAAHEDWLQIWPGHGAGSACGKGISAIPSSTLGYERRFNWAFRVRTEDEFVRRVLEGQPDPPTYFGAMKRLNKGGPPLLRDLAPPSRLDTAAVLDRLARGHWVVDTRSAGEFAAEHLPGTLNLPMNASFVSWAGWLLPYDQDVTFLLDPAHEANIAELRRRLALIGFDRIAAVADAMAVADAAARGAAVTTVPQVTTDLLADQIAAGQVRVVDVRNDAEWQAGHIDGAVHAPLGRLATMAHTLPTDRPVVVQCRSGARSAIAASLLRRLGVPAVSNLVGGLMAWQAAGLPVTQDTSAV